jgi:hypothetical protein
MSQSGWTKREGALDDRGRKAPAQADRGSVCNVFGRACTVAVALLFAGVQAGTAKASGEALPGVLSTQIQGAVSSAVSGGKVDDLVNGAVAMAENVAPRAQPLNNASATKAEGVVSGAVAMAESVSTEVVPVAAPTVESSAPVAQGSSRTRIAPGRPRSARHVRPHQRARTQVPASKTVIQSGMTGNVAGAPMPDAPLPRVQIAKAAPRPQRSAAPGRPLPAPPSPSRPDASSAGQSEGQSTPVPSLLAALAGVLLIFGLNFLPRTLPKSAFRKPRLVALPPWHPG